MNTTWLENELTTKTYYELRHKVQALVFPLEQVEKALAASAYKVTMLVDGNVVGMGRLVGDGVIYWYLQDIVVAPEYQGMNLGRQLINHLIAQAKKRSIPNSEIIIGLLSIKGKEEFYEKLGFIKRPNDEYGAGMIMKVSV